jgi:hypothetical protein
MKSNLERDSAEIRIHVAERSVRTPSGFVRCEIDREVQFRTDGLESYFFARWEPVAYDALLVAAAVEFADITNKRPLHSWSRTFDLRIPVHDPARWNSPNVSTSLREALDFLTGDRWTISFHARRSAEPPPKQGLLTLGSQVDAVIPYSNGLDSRAVAGILAQTMRDSLVRVRLGSTLPDGELLLRSQQAFTAVPYHVRPQRHTRRESSGRSRGFKFAMVSAIAAYLANAGRVIVPESGQGALGPVLVAVGQTYEDYRNHPLFTRRFQVLVHALFDRQIEFTFPQVWRTKGETLREYIEATHDSSWKDTRSCWQQNRHVSVDRKARQCGICAACMLRRMSVHAAGLSEPAASFLWEKLSASSFEQGVSASFSRTKVTSKLREYAIAGVLHLDHLAALLQSKSNECTLNLASFQLSKALGQPTPDVRVRLERLLQQHSAEWQAFLGSLGSGSFVSRWAGSIDL